MNIRTLALSTAIASVMLAACSKPAEPAPTPAAPAPAAEAARAAPEPVAPTDATVPAEAAAPAPEPAPAAAPEPAAAAPAPATAASCAIDIEANDMMKYNVSSIAVPASCAKFTINLKHVGKMPVTAMGHNVVIAKESDAAGIVADGMSVTPEHIKAGDARVIAHTKMLGGGQSGSVTFDVSRIKTGGPFQFFCSFPGHYVLMKGSIKVE